jgi:hypothetical protein
MKHDALLKQARKRFDLAATADRESREEGLSDLRAVTGIDLWAPEVKAKREANGHVCLTVNQLPQFLRQVTGDLRRMNPAIKVSASDADGSEEIAEIYEGIVRHVEYRSDASSVYEGAAESAASSSIGYFRILTEYENPFSFNQEIRIELIHNPFSVHFDPEARMATREDAAYCFVTQDMTKDDFEAEYPDAATVDFDDDNLMLEHWRSGDDVTVAEYFWREFKTVNLTLLIDGTVLRDQKAPKELIVAERESRVPVIKWAKISGSAVLDGPREIPGEHIPVIAVTGEELFIGDRWYRSSVVRHAKDPARMYNYWWSAQTEVVALQPKAPYSVTLKQIAGLETFWNRANDSNLPYLPHNPDPQAPAPTRMAPPMSSPGMMDMIQLAGADMRSTTGIYDASLGQRSNEQSGVAIRQRQMESDVSTSVYGDNMGKAIAHCGRIIVGMIPLIYDTTRIVRIVGSDGAQKMVEINKPIQTPDGEMVVNDLSRGKYDVRVSVGPSYSTKRQEAAEGMMEFVRVYPAAAQVAGDLIAKNMDLPGADELADRLKKILPPGMAETEDPRQQQQQAAAAQQQQQGAQAMQALEVREAEAKVAQAEANAKKAQADAAKAEFEMMAAQSGLLQPY